MSSWKTSELSQKKPDCLCLVQLTDTHILPGEGDDFDGIDTFVSLVNVIRDLRQHEVWPPDGVLVTGDLVHKTEFRAYQRLKDQLESLDVPVFCIAGNHDEPELMREVLPSDHIHLTEIISTRNWRIILLNSFIPGTHAGRIDNADLDQLDQVLASDHKPVLLCLHHPPVSVHSSWMDSMSLENPDELFAVLDRHDHIKCILWGHIHQVFEEQRNDVMLLATPSTCVQFTPGTDRYIRDHRSPGFRWLKLYESGKLETSIYRIPDSG